MPGAAMLSSSVDGAGSVVGAALSPLSKLVRETESSAPAPVAGLRPRDHSNIDNNNNDNSYSHSHRYSEPSFDALQQLVGQSHGSYGSLADPAGAASAAGRERGAGREAKAAPLFRADDDEILVIPGLGGSGSGAGAGGGALDDLSQSQSQSQYSVQSE